MKVVERPKQQGPLIPVFESWLTVMSTEQGGAILLNELALRMDGIHFAFDWAVMLHCFDRTRKQARVCRDDGQVIYVDLDRFKAANRFQRNLGDYLSDNGLI